MNTREGPVEVQGNAILPLLLQRLIVRLIFVQGLKTGKESRANAWRAIRFEVPNDFDT